MDQTISPDTDFDFEMETTPAQDTRLNTQWSKGPDYSNKTGTSTVMTNG